MVNRIDEETADSEALDRRLKSLTNFQAMLLRHALRFPSVRRVVYSTCSVYERENELVIQDVLQSSEQFQLVDILPKFSSRGKSSELLGASSCVRLSPETCLTIGFFVACLERVDEVPGRHCRSSSKLEFDDRKKHIGMTVSKSATCKMQVENSTADEERKLHKRKKLQKAKTARVEYSEVDGAVVKDGSNSEVDREQQKSLSEKLSLLSVPTTGTLETETLGEIKKLHKRKKSKREKSAKLAKLELPEVDLTVGLDCLYNSPDMHSSSDVMQTSGRKLRKHKKLKKEKSAGIEQSETRTPSVKKGESELDRQSHMSSNENTSFGLESIGGIVETEEDVMKESRKLHKHKKSKKEKAAKSVEPEQPATDDAVVFDRLKLKKSRKHKKRCLE